MNNPVAPREIRVFLSSTVKDMEAERSHLIKRGISILFHIGALFATLR
jgi:hypothetical protein